MQLSKVEIFDKICRCIDSCNNIEQLNNYYKWFKKAKYCDNNRANNRVNAILETYYSTKLLQYYLPYDFVDIILDKFNIKKEQLSGHGSNG